MIRIFCIALLSFIIVSCKSDVKQTTSPQEAIEVSEKESPMKAMPMEEIKKMYDLVDQIDYEFHSLPISMALSEKQGIQNNISYISPTVQWNIPAECKHMGKQLFYHKAELMYEADFYFDENCRFLVFLKDGKPMYCNKFTPHGQKFYENVFKQVSGMKQTTS